MYRNVIGAIDECQSLSGGRLVASKNCDELDKLRQEMHDVDEIPVGQEFYVGNFAYGFDKAMMRRAKPEDKEITS